MYIVTGVFPNKTVSKKFQCVLDATEYRDQLDAHYARVIFEYVR